LALKDGLTRYLDRKRSRALNILSLSGGGQNGAFGAGFLVGWRESGQRPEFFNRISIKQPFAGDGAMTGDGRFWTFRTPD
jgi:hypothetical protein